MSDLGTVVGTNVRRLRTEAGIGQLRLLDAVKSIGGRWSTGTLDALEHGRRRITVEDLVIASGALTEATGRDVTVRDLLATDERITVGAFNLAADTLLRVLAGESLSGAVAQTFPAIFRDPGEFIKQLPEDLQRKPPGQTLGEWVAATSAVTEADKRIAATMDMAPRVFAAWSAHLWGGRGFTEERDRRGDGENAQKRGRITRDMKTELAESYNTHVPAEPMTSADLEHATEVLRSRGLIPGGDRGDD